MGHVYPLQSIRSSSLAPFPHPWLQGRVSPTTLPSFLRPRASSLSVSMTPQPRDLRSTPVGQEPLPSMTFPSYFLTTNRRRFFSTSTHQPHSLNISIAFSYFPFHFSLSLSLTLTLFPSDLHFLFFFCSFVPFFFVSLSIDLLFTFYHFEHLLRPLTYF